MVTPEAAGRIALEETRHVPLEAGAVRGEALRRSMRLITTAWLSGAIWQNATTGAPLTLFAEQLHANGFQFGLLSAIPFLASLASLPASLLIDRTGKRKSIFLWGLYANRLLWFPLAILPYLLVSRYGLGQTRHAMTLFILLFLFMNCGQGVGGPAWTSWMADLIPPRVRGSYFSKRRQWAMLTGIPAAFFAGWLLDRPGVTGVPMATLQWCMIIFVVAAVFGLGDIHLFQYVPEIRKTPVESHRLIEATLRPLKNRQFIWFSLCVATLTFALSFMAQFVTLYLVEQVHVTNSATQNILLVAPMVAQLLVLPIWGRAADRMGKKPLMAIASLGLVPVGLGWCFMTHGNVWLGYLISAAGGALWTGVEVANLNLVLELAASQDNSDADAGSSYVVMNSVIINIAGCLGGVTSGLVAQGLSDWHWTIPGFKTVGFYDVLFALSAVMRLAAVVIFLPLIVEPAARPTREALRFMSSNIYSNLSAAFLQPLRWVRRERSGQSR